MKCIFLRSLLIAILVSACSKRHSHSIKLCLDKGSKGWFYVFLTPEEKGKNTGECLKFDKNNILVIPRNWMEDSTKINLFKEGVDYNDSAYFLSSGDYLNNEKKTYRYYSFFINDTLDEKYIYSDQFKLQEYNSFNKKWIAY